MNTRSEASPPVIDEGGVDIRRTFDDLLDYAIMHTELVEHEDEARQSPLVTEAKKAIAALEAGCAGLVAENALLKRAFLAGHAEGWTGNQQRRDVQHVDAEKSWNLYVENGALNKSRTALRGVREQVAG
jgi:hypothetical protein